MARSKAKAVDESVQLTKYEKARVLGSRALQISQGAPYLVKVSKEKLEEIRYNPLEIAKMELEAGVIPITVTRPLPEIKKEAKEEKKEKKEEKAEE
jgi:DNA-directed RNA polymerase subunit K/omega